MEPFITAFAIEDEWGRAAQTCIDRLGVIPAGANLGMVYVTDLLSADLPSILTYLRQRTGIEHWTGTIGMGIIHGAEEVFEQPAMAVMLLSLPADGFHVFPTIRNGMGDMPPPTRAWIDQACPTFAIVHGDTTNPELPRLIEEVADTLPAFLVGGLTASRERNHQIADDITEGGVSGVFFAPEIEVATGLSQGCTPIAASHIVSDCVDNVLIGLDGRRALDVFVDDIGEDLARNLNQIPGLIHAAFPIEGSDTGDYTVRNLTGIDPNQGWLAVGGEVFLGERIFFVCRDRTSAEQDLEKMTMKLKRRISRPPRGGLYISCVARGPNMFRQSKSEMSIIRDAMGDIPLIGVYVGGEISNRRIYGYTGVLTLFL